MLTEDTFKKIEELEAACQNTTDNIKKPSHYQAGMAWKQSMWLKTFQLVQSTRKVFTGAMLLSTFCGITLKMVLKTSKKHGRTLIG